MRAAGLEIRKFRHLDIEDLKFQIEGYQGPPPDNSHRWCLRHQW
jgi:hypothetical protein